MQSSELPYVRHLRYAVLSANHTSYSSCDWMSFGVTSVDNEPIWHVLVSTVAILIQEPSYQIVRTVSGIQ